MTPVDRECHISILEEQFERLDIDKYDYDLLRRIEKCRAQYLVSLTTSSSSTLSERTMASFANRTSERMDHLYARILTRHQLPSDYFIRCNEQIYLAIAQQDLQRIAFLSENLTKNRRGIHLQAAAKNGQLEIVRILLESGRISEEHRGWAVREALENCHLEIVQLLLKSGTIPEYYFGDAVRSAAKNGHLEILQILLKSRAISEYYFGDAVRLAAQNGHLEFVRILLASRTISEGNRGWALSNAAQNGHLEIVQILLENGSIFERDRGGALFNAAQNGHQEIVRILLASGTISEGDIGRALSIAVQRAHQEVVQAFLANGIIYQGHERIVNTPRILILSFEELVANPNVFLAKVALEGFPDRISLIDDTGAQSEVFDAGGVRKEFVTTLFKALQPKLNVQSNTIPFLEEGSRDFEAKKMDYRNLGRFFSYLIRVNIGRDNPILIGSFVDRRFYEILKCVAIYQDPMKAVAQILTDYDSNLQALANTILHPGNEDYLKAFCEIYGCELGSTFDRARKYMESYLLPAQCLLEGCLPDLAKKIKEKSSSEIVNLIQGEPVTQKALLEALELFPGATERLIEQLGWIQEKIKSSDVNWCKRFIRWATGMESIPLRAKIYLRLACYGDLFVHTCSNTIDIPNSASKEQLLEALEFVFDAPLNRV